jgi:competence protein ComGF
VDQLEYLVISILLDLLKPFSYSDFRTSTSLLLFLFQSILEPAGQQGEYIRQAQAKPLPSQDKEPALTP